MAAKLKIEKRGDEIKKKSSPLKLVNQNFVLIEHMVSDKKIFVGISHRVLCEIKFGYGGHLGLCSEMPDTVLEAARPFDQDGPHSRT
jgi:hypothetical protein